MPCILLFETEYSLEFVYTNLPFLSRPSDTKIQTAITWCLQQQKSQKFENVRLWTSIFRYENLKIVSFITCELFNRNLSIVHPTLFFNSVIAPILFKNSCIKRFHNKEIKSFAACVLSALCRNSRPEVSSEKGVLRNFAKFTGKHLCQSFFFNYVAGLRRLARPSRLLRNRNVDLESRKTHSNQRTNHARKS